MRFNSLHFASGKIGLLLLMVLVSLTLGCKKEVVRGLPVSGTVNWEQQPLKSGYIRFTPKSKGLSSGAAIVDGKFELTGQKGLPSGTYLVQITSEKETGREISDSDFPGQKIKETKQYIPRRYNLRSKLELIVQDSPVVQSFDLTK